MSEKKPAWQKFWFVWGGREQHVPKMRHETMDAAITEAKRLASEHVGRPFIVLSAKCLVRVTEKEKPARVRWFSRPKAVGPTAEQQALHPNDETLTETDDAQQEEASSVAV